MSGAPRLVADRFTLTGLISQGGMGQVWEAYDERLGRRVAVKLMRPELLTGTRADDLRRRFLRESQTTARIDHPGLVTVHDAGTDADELYLVMQHVDGADLADHLAEHDPYPWPWAVAVGAQLCGILAAVHEVPVVHRDLKPRNVMVRQDGRVVLLDLGIAATLSTDTTRLTRTGAMLGSPAYMAPEQAFGGPVGPRTDLYALGVLLHELVSGRPPFGAPTEHGVLYQQLNERPVPLRSVRPETPAQLEALVLRLLEKEPDHRPRSAQEVYAELVPLLPTVGPLAPRLDPLRPFRRPLAPWPDADTVPPGPPAAATGPALATGVEDVRRLLGEGRVTQAVDLLGGLLPAAEAAGDARVVRVLRKQYASTLLDLGEYRRALPVLLQLARERAAESGAADPDALQYRYEAAQCLEQLGEHMGALAEYQALQPYYENPYAGVDPRQLLELRLRIAQLLPLLGRAPEARHLLSRLLPDAEALYGPAHPFPADVRHRLTALSGRTH